MVFFKKNINYPGRRPVPSRRLGPAPVLQGSLPRLQDIPGGGAGLRLLGAHLTTGTVPFH